MSTITTTDSTLRLLPVSCVILAKNEESNIDRCLASIQGHTDDIIVIDSHSSDQTVDLVRKFTNRIYIHRYDGHPQQWDWALHNILFKYDWIFAIDADFAITPQLWEAIAAALGEGANPQVDGFFVRHRQVFLGRTLKYGTTHPRPWLRLFRQHRVQVNLDDFVDIHFYVNGPVGFLDGDVIEDNVKDRDLRFWVDKQARFARSLALEELRRRAIPTGAGLKASLFGRPDERIMWCRKRWYSLPLYIRPFLLFFYRYVLRLGFLDGKEGLLYHFTQALVCRLLVDGYLDDLTIHPSSVISGGLVEGAPMTSNAPSVSADH